MCAEPVSQDSRLALERLSAQHVLRGGSMLNPATRAPHAQRILIVSLGRLVAYSAKSWACVWEPEVAEPGTKAYGVATVH